MTLINRYITLEITRYFGMTLLSVLSIFIAVDYLGTMDDFIEAEISLWRAFQYVLYKIPLICNHAMPMVLLISILIVFGLMSKNNELIIINSSGISIYALLKPVLMVCITIALLLFYLAEQAVPFTTIQANAIKNREIRKKASVTVKEKNIWIKGKRQITHIKYFHSPSQAIYGFTRYFFDNKFLLIRRVDAQKGEFHDGQWILSDCMVQELDQTDNTYAISIHEILKEDLQLYPEDFRLIVRKSEEMNFGELLAYVRKVETEGYDATVYKVDLYAKSAYPFVCIIMGLVGVGLTARRRLNKGLPVSITYGIAIGFFYWVFQSFCVSLGYGGVLPPIVAAWVANFIFLCFGLILVVNAE